MRHLFKKIDDWESEKIQTSTFSFAKYKFEMKIVHTFNHTAHQMLHVLLKHFEFCTVLTTTTNCK